jgi:biofilm PGA synthesis protein PgaA
VRPGPHLAFVGAFLAWGYILPGWADVAPDKIESTYAEHTRGVNLARAGRHDEALAVLLPLLQRFPDDYPLQRDVVLISTWKGDCPGALTRFERLRHYPDLEPYLLVAVTDCLLDANRPQEARHLARRAHERYPEDESLRDAFLKADFVLRVDQNRDDERPAVEASLHNDTSDQGLAEWIGRVEGSARIAEDTRLYARYRLTRSTESQYRDGDLDRVGVGLRYRYDEQFFFDQEFSADIFESGQGGSTTRVVFEPRDAWRFMAAYASFAEEIPLRARAAGIDARQVSANAAYERRDYRWEALAGIDYFDFSDTNQRTDIYASAGYAYEMRARREQRLFLEWSQSQNSLDGAVYFNPSHDNSLGLVHRTDFVYDSRYRRHVDHLWVGVNAYTQEGFGTHGRWALRYEQDYDFDESRALAVSAGVGRNVYDGKYETEVAFYLTYQQRF